MATAKIWRNRIEAGTKTFQECPERYRADVLTFMRADVAEGKITGARLRNSLVILMKDN